MYKKVDSKESLHVVIFCKALQIMRLLDKDINNLELDSFSIGDGFFDSLIKCQCSPNSRFADVFLDTVGRLLAGSPKNQEQPFRVGKEASSEQRKKGNQLAFRTHMTKSKEGLRLMYWKCNFGRIELANVGNKQELEII